MKHRECSPYATLRKHLSGRNLRVVDTVNVERLSIIGLLGIAWSKIGAQYTLFFDPGDMRFSKGIPASIPSPSLVASLPLLHPAWLFFSTTCQQKHKSQPLVLYVKNTQKWANSVAASWSKFRSQAKLVSNHQGQQIFPDKEGTSRSLCPKNTVCGWHQRVWPVPCGCLISTRHRMGDGRCTWGEGFKD